MGGFEAKGKKKSIVKIAGLALVGLILGAALLCRMPQVSDDTEAPAAEQTEMTPNAAATEIVVETTAEPMVAGVVYPVELEGGRLTLENLFEFEGINPDCGYASGESIASISVKNVSEAFLTEAELTLTLADGSVIDFLVTNLPAGKAAMAFAVDNAQLDMDNVCVDVTCGAAWDEDTAAIPEAVTVTVDGTTVTITNNTTQDISGLTIYCRDRFDEEYFGGKAYEYTVQNLSARGQATVEAIDCILGQAEVVRIAIHE